MLSLDQLKDQIKEIRHEYLQAKKQRNFDQIEHVFNRRFYKLIKIPIILENKTI